MLSPDEVSSRSAPVCLSTLHGEWCRRVNLERLLETTRELWETEFGQTFACYHASARLAERKLHEAGCEQVERLPFPADGRSVFQDKTLPIGWRAATGRLEVVEAALPFEPAVIADFQKHPFHLIKGSVATPPEGVETRLVTQEALEAGADARGALVLLHPEQRPTCRVLAGSGALGLVSDFLVGRHETPWAHSWVNGCSDSQAWHTGADDRPFIGFSISPATGDRLREALRMGEVRVRATSDGERYEDTVEAVTGVIPGSDPREIWLLAHLYEPLANDNSAGVACALEIARTLRTLVAEKVLPPPRFTLRLVFAMEVYGFAAYAEHRGGHLRDKVLCALNLDALPILPGDGAVTLGLSQSGAPSAADAVLEALFAAGLPRHHTVANIESEGLYADDRQLGDSTIGVPVLWFTRAKRALATAPVEGSRRPLYLWHHSEQTMECLCPGFFHEVTALYGTLASLLLAPDPASPARWLEQAAATARARLEATHQAVLRGEGVPDWLRFRLEIETLRLRDHLRFGAPAPAVEAEVAALQPYAAALSAALPQTSPPTADPFWAEVNLLLLHRKHRGLPRDLAAAPVGKREIHLSHAGALLLVHADSRRTVGELLRRAQWETATLFDSDTLRGLLDALRILDRYGYVGLEPIPLPSAAEFNALCNALGL
ncbi:MAG TPA: DUF4910 domain-containing protein [Chthoniobacteraceae bacterium]|nr:DUF4910 domain-containing protein [Chthoniobacteraceae bacterium]